MNRVNGNELLQEIEFSNVKLVEKGGFWNKRMQMNEEHAIFYQWNQLETSGTIDNFRLKREKKDLFRRGFFYSDSDLHKWAEAASLILISAYQQPNSHDLEIIHQIEIRLKEYINLIADFQRGDGYLFTYNQYHFPTRQWANLQIEHELYTIGHLIEGSVALNSLPANRFPSNTKFDIDELNEPEQYLTIAKRAVEKIIRDFTPITPNQTPGHQEIEIALIKLYEKTHSPEHLQLAFDFLFQRGKMKGFGWRFLKQAISQAWKMRNIKKQYKKYLETKQDINPNKINTNEVTELDLTENLVTENPRGLLFRALHLFWTGKYNQQHLPIVKQIRPEGHAVRFTYQATAASRLLLHANQITSENWNHSYAQQLQKTLCQAWDHLVQKQMYITGGIGSIPLIEGFGYDYELNNTHAYCETCAAIGNIFWTWNMLLLTKEAKYADLIEWTLYNAASVGIAVDGQSYLYRNPLSSEGNLKRRKWYATPCCPSNISRLWATLGKYIYSIEERSDRNSKTLFIHQYITNIFQLENEKVQVSINSQFPWGGEVDLHITKSGPHLEKLVFRVPGWCSNPQIRLNQETIKLEKLNQYRNSTQEINIQPNQNFQCAGGYSPYQGQYYELPLLENQQEFHLQLDFPMKIKEHEADPKVKDCRNKRAITRGPLVYCVESKDNTHWETNTPFLSVEDLDSRNFHEMWQTDPFLLNEDIPIIEWNIGDQKFTAIPYFLWGNRGSSKMQVWIPTQTQSSKKF